jgi:hypothetical protein
MFRIDGRDDDFLYLSTASLTRGNEGLRHDQVIDVRTGEIFCTCEDCQYRHRTGHLLTKRGFDPCKHIKKLLTLAEL